MSSPLENYKAFIDGLLGWPRSSVVARWVGEWDKIEDLKTYQVPKDHPLYRLVPGLTAEQRDALCEVLQAERDSGIHATLAYLETYTIAKGQEPLASEPFGTEMYYDFVARRDGDEWPPDPDTMP